MIPTYDIFRLEADGTHWVDAVISVEDAKTRIQELVELTPGQYIVLNQKTQEQFIVKGNAVIPHNAAEKLLPRQEL